jgi:von Willebrand factor type A domain
MAFPSSRSRAIPSPDARRFRRPWLRTTVVRGVLVLLACGLLAAAFLSARTLEPRSSELTPGGRSGVVVIDVSLSIVTRDYAQVRSVLERLIRADNPMGLVIFSDAAYELLPPRTPARELRPLLRFFTLRDNQLPPNPWTPSFQAGTRISTAIQMAQDMIVRDGVSPASILLISDLESAPTDYTALGKTLSRIRQSSTTMRVFPLSASSEARSLFEGLVGADAFVDPVEPNAGEVPSLDVSLRGELPLWLLLTGGLALVVLALHERFGGRLALPSGAGWRRT